MDQIQKQWQKLSEKDRLKFKKLFEALKQRNFSNLDRKKLKGYDYIFRIRIGNYRVIYYDDGEKILLKYLKKRNEKTYKEI